MKPNCGQAGRISDVRALALRELGHRMRRVHQIKFPQAGKS
jgi:hypothetical protein